MDLNIKFIQDSFELVKPRAEEFATRFYSTLFQDYPAIQNLFASSDLDKQKRLLVASLVQVVHNLENPEFLGEYLGKMGERHADYGLQEPHFEWVGLSLLKTLGAMFGSDWSREHNRQWALAFDVIAALMRDGLLRKQVTSEPEPKVVPLRKVETEKSAPNSVVTVRVNLPRELTEQLDQMAKAAVREAVQSYFDQAVERETRQTTLRKVS